MIFSRGKLNPRYKPISGYRHTPEGKVWLRCAQCRKIFYLWPYMLRRKNRQKFCDWRCFQAHHRSARIVQCAQCGEKIIRPPSLLRGKKRIYCGRNCQRIGQRKRVSFTCTLCRKTFSARPSSRTSRKVLVYCGRFCSNLAQTLRSKRGRVYTPEFLASLATYNGPNCAQLFCKKTKTGKNAWNLCVSHNARVSVALSKYKKQRTTQLTREGL